MRVTDAVETRSALEKIMRGHPILSQFINFYVKPEDAAKLTPDDIAMMRKHTELRDRAKKYAKQKREQITVAPGSAGIGVQQWPTPTWRSKKRGE